MESTPTTTKQHRLNLTVTDELYKRLSKINSGRRRLNLDTVDMLEEYIGYRERYGKNIFQGIYDAITSKA